MLYSKEFAKALCRGSLRPVLEKYAQFWIQSAIKREGALRETARREGGIDPRTGKIKKSWALKKKKELEAKAAGDRKLTPNELKLLRRINLYLTLLKFPRRGRS